MKIRILSDLHFEFHRDGGKSFASEQSDKGYDCMVLAGDISSGPSGIEKAVKLLCKSAGSRPVVFVPGNHEYYGSDFRSVDERLSKCSDSIPNFHVLNNEFKEILGQRFIGSTLWFKHSGKIEREDAGLNDFNMIEEFREWVGKKAEKSAKFLKENIQNDDVVITHHLPARESIHSAFKNSSFNKYFLHDVRETVEKGAKLWIHGHTHMSMDYTIGSTRVVCNPFGYARHEENSRFINLMTIEI